MANGYTFETYNAQLTVHAACEKYALHIIFKFTWYPQNICRVVPDTITLIRQDRPINVTHCINSLGVNSHFLSMLGRQLFSMIFCVVKHCSETMLKLGTEVQCYPAWCPQNRHEMGVLYCTISWSFKQRVKATGSLLFGFISAEHGRCWAIT